MYLKHYLSSLKKYEPKLIFNSIDKRNYLQFHLQQKIQLYLNTK